MSLRSVSREFKSAVSDAVGCSLLRQVGSNRRRSSHESRVARRAGGGERDALRSGVRHRPRPRPLLSSPSSAFGPTRRRCGRRRQKVERRSWRRDRAALPPRRGGNDQSRGPPRHRARRAITVRDGPRHPPGATEQQQQQARRDARERVQPTKLDLFRSYSDVEPAAVDLEADIPPELDGDSVES
jgi:hypothetical protein